MLSTIAVEVDELGFRFAADSQATTGNAVDTNADKLWVVGDVVLGVCGRWKAVNVLRYRLAIPKFRKKDSVESWMVNRFVPRVEKLLAEEGLLTGSEESPLDLSGEFQMLVGFQKRVFSVGTDMSVMEVAEYEAIGSGGDFAKGAMAMGATATQAVEAAILLDAFTGGDVKTVEVYG